MSKILDLALEKDTICVFDIDGVLIPYEYGEYNHNVCTDEEWDNNPEYYASLAYNNIRPVTVLQEFIKKKKERTVYVCSKASQDERTAKGESVHRFYHIPMDRIIFVNETNEKLEVLKEIKEMHPSIKDYQLVFIDDTVKTLTYVQENSGFSTMHISSFL